MEASFLFPKRLSSGKTQKRLSQGKTQKKAFSREDAKKGFLKGRCLIQKWPLVENYYVMETLEFYEAPVGKNNKGEGTI